MNPPTTLARPLAARVRDLPEVLPPRQPNHLPSEDVLEQAALALEAGKTHYTDRPGILPLREKISAYLHGLGLPIAPDAITITCGVEEARFVALKQLSTPGQLVYSFNEAEVEELRNTGSHAAYQPDYLQLLREFDSACALLQLHISTSVEKPDVAYAADIWGQGSHKFAELLEQNDKFQPSWIVLELYRYVNSDDSKQGIERLVSVLKQRDLLSRLLVIKQLHSIPSWRVGFMAGSSAHAKLRAYKQSMTICTPSVSQWAALGVNLGESQRANREGETA